MKYKRPTPNQTDKFEKELLRIAYESLEKEALPDNKGGVAIHAKVILQTMAEIDRIVKQKCDDTKSFYYVIASEIVASALWSVIVGELVEDQSPYCHGGSMIMGFAMAVALTEQMATLSVFDDHFVSDEPMDSSYKAADALKYLESVK